MSLTQAANLIEKVIGHGSNAITAQDVTNPARDRAKYGHPTETMQALVWQAKNKVEVVTVPRPIVVENRDVILKVTGSTVCGSDLHLLHGSVIQLQKGDILGHEFCGTVHEMGSEVKGLAKGDRVVASFQIACGSVCLLGPQVKMHLLIPHSVECATRNSPRSARKQIPTAPNVSLMSELTFMDLVPRN